MDHPELQFYKIKKAPARITLMHVWVWLELFSSYLKRRAIISLRSGLTDDYITNVQMVLNNRFRKRLNYLSAQTAFDLLAQYQLNYDLF